MNISKNRILLGLGLLTVALFLVYRSCAGSGLNVEPHAAREIQKAKER